MRRTTAIGNQPGFGRVHARRGSRALLGVLAVLIASPASAKDYQSEPPLTVVMPGGAPTRAKMRAMVRPYRERLGRWVEVKEVTSPLEEMSRQVASENVKWDVVSLDMPAAVSACQNGLVEKIEPSSLPPAKDGTPASQDFIPEAFQACGVGYAIWATVVAYDRTSGKKAPTKLADFFDTRRFPGRRGLRREPQVAMEWALLADGVAPDEIYSTLETRRGVDRAFKMLDRIRDDIVWWFHGREGPELIATGKVAMASAWNGRVHIRNEREDRIGIIWDRAIWNIEVWVIPRGSARKAQALEFIRESTTTAAMLRQADEIPYGSPRRSAEPLFPPAIAKTLPTSHAETHLKIDFVWWAENAERLNPLFERWINRGPAYDFDNMDRN